MMPLFGAQSQQTLVLLFYDWGGSFDTCVLGGGAIVFLDQTFFWLPA